MAKKKLVVTEIPRVEWSNQPILTTAQLAEFYETTAENLRVNFFNAQKQGRFVEGKHYFKLEGEELEILRVKNFGLQISPKTRTLCLWTERGAARHAKMLNTEKAWEVFEALEDNYFNRPVGKKPDFFAIFSDFVGVERDRVVLDNDRLNFEREKFLVENSEDKQIMAQVQLLRELASASGENQSMRNDLVRHATILLVGDIFRDKDILLNKQRIQ